MKTKTEAGEPLALDYLASLARTALDDPHGLPEVPENPTGYAIDRLDAVINALNPAYETNETFRHSLRILGIHLADRQERIESCNLDDDDPAKAEAVELLTLALDYIDSAISALTPEEER